MELKKLYQINFDSKQNFKRKNLQEPTLKLNKIVLKSR